MVRRPGMTKQIILAADKESPMTTKTGHVAVNGVRYYYEIHGQGAPLLLLHGGLGSIDMFRPSLLPALAQTHQVIAVDLEGHGRTQLGDRPLSLVDQGDDMVHVLDALGVEQADVMGYSLGGGVAFQLAVQHPERVRRLVLVSMSYTRAGFYPEMLPMQEAIGAHMLAMMKPTPMYQSYVAVAPDPDEFPELLDRMGEYMRKDYDWTAEVKRLAATDVSVLLVYGDHDMFRPEHEIAFFQLLGGGQRDAGWQREHMSRHRLAILPNVTHYDMFTSPQLAPAALAFLDDNARPTSWAEQVSRN
jgi:pimeloyl-ACP methyl ester carboxylesterase